jgi:DNA polymerase-1
MDKLMVVDGNSIVNRAFYGLQGPSLLSTSDGFPTNAILGFVNILHKFIEEENPQFLCVAFDLSAPTFRHLEFDDYKATRKPMPDDLAIQLPVLKEILDAMNITRVEIEGYEADDIIGTLSKCAEQKGMETIILTGDRDSLQLASKLTRIKLPITRNRKTETEEYDDKGVMEKYGVTPSQFIDVKGLMGDRSDNIPGVPGIGEKTAIKLIKQFGSIENIYENLDAVEQKGVRQKLADNRELAFGSKYMATIDRDVPMPCSIEDCRRKEFDVPRLYKLFGKLEFKSLIERLNLDIKEAQANTDRRMYAEPKEVILIKDFESVLKLKEKIMQQASVEVFYIIEKIDEFHNSLDAAAFLLDDRTVAIIWFTEGISEEKFLAEFEEVFSNPDIKKSGHDMKVLITHLKRKGIEFKGLEFDTMLAAYILEPASSDYSISSLAGKYLSQIIANLSALTGKGKKYIPFRELDREELNSAICEQCMAMYELRELFVKMINENNQHILYYEIELPLVYVLADMEFRGFKVNEEEFETDFSKSGPTDKSINR